MTHWEKTVCLTLFLIVFFNKNYIHFSSFSSKKSDPKHLAIR